MFDGHYLSSSLNETFFPFTHVRKFILLITFLWEFFMKLFQQILNHNDTHIEYLKKYFFGLY